MTVKTAAEGGFEVRRGELDWSAMDEAARAEFEELFGGVDPKGLLIQQSRIPPPDIQRSFAQIGARAMAFTGPLVWVARSPLGTARVVQANRPDRLQPVSEYSRPEHCQFRRTDR